MFLVSWIWFSMPYLVIARMGLFNNEKHMINDTLWVECKWKGLQIKVLQRLAFFVLMTLCCWQSKNINFHLLMFKFWYKARWKNPEYQLDVNSIYTCITDINFWNCRTNGQMSYALLITLLKSKTLLQQQQDLATGMIQIWWEYCVQSFWVFSEAGAGDSRVKSYNGGEKSHLRWLDPVFFLGGGVPSYFEALWYPHLYFYRKSNT